MPPSVVLEAWLLENILSEVDRFGARISAEQASLVQLPKVNPAKLEEKLRRLGVVYTSGGMSGDEYLAAAADLRQQIQDAKKAGAYAPARFIQTACGSQLRCPGYLFRAYP